MKDFAQTSQNFSFFWRGFYLIDATQEEMAINHARDFCALLKANDDLISDYYCTERDFQQNSQNLNKWIQDASLRGSALSLKAFEKSAQKQLAFASLPGIPRSLISSLRVDPLGASQEFWKLKEKAFFFTERFQGYLSNAEHSVIMIPFSLKSSPQDIQSSATFMSSLKGLCEEQCPKTTLLGPHAAIWLNQTQVLSDLSLLTVLGVFFFLVTLFFLGLKRGAAILSLCLPLLISIAVSIAITVCFFGSIHGLTLAFGPSLVGMVLDYGIHTKIHQGAKGAWSSNFFGLLTTLSGFLVLSFSEIPLVRQIILFAVSGLIVSFVLYYFFSKSQLRLWTKTSFPPFKFQLPFSSRGSVVAAFIALCPFFLWPFLKLDLNLKNFEFRQKYQDELEEKTWKTTKAPEVLFKLYPTSELENAHDDDKVSESLGVAQQSWGLYVPSLELQKKNLLTWTPSVCDSYRKLESSTLKFFSPFYDLGLCSNSYATPANPPTYVQDFLSQDKSQLLSVWFPKNAVEKNQLLEQFPSLVSLRSIFESFPKLLLREIWTMFPLGFLLCFSLLYFHTRRFSFTLLSLVPLFSACGLIFLSFVFMGKAFSFVSCVALLMIFGTSVDYGIFKVDALRVSPSNDSSEKTLSSLIMNALLTFVGYLPLVFAKHPVLNDLGYVLTLGTIGAFVGGVWGVPYFAGLRRTFKAQGQDMRTK
ncbi:MAG: hypothetical protein R3A80_04070 [Bdellovibrionota bacterium]